MYLSSKALHCIRTCLSISGGWNFVYSTYSVPKTINTVNAVSRITINKESYWKLQTYSIWWTKLSCLPLVSEELANFLLESLNGNFVRLQKCLDEGYNELNGSSSTRDKEQAEGGYSENSGHLVNKGQNTQEWREQQPSPPSCPVLNSLWGLPWGSSG